MGPEAVFTPGRKVVSLGGRNCRLWEPGLQGSGGREPGLEVCGLNTTKPLPDSRFNAGRGPLHKHKHSANE